jgi:sugar-specific transcriptional regulator TrmB
LSEIVVMKALRDFGLTDRESQVYLFVAKKGILGASCISKSLGKHKAQIYQILKNLQNMGVIEATLESPVRFAAVPFDRVIDLNIKKKKAEINFLVEEKSDLLTQWKSVSSEKPITAAEKFMVIEGRNSMYSRILQMIEDAKKEFLCMTSRLGVIRADQAGIIDAIIRKRNIHFRILVDISEENLDVLRRFVKNSIKSPNIRQINPVSSTIPRFVVRDEEEALFSIAPRESSSIHDQDETSLWTNSKGFSVMYAKAFFDELWRSSTNANDKMKEIENREKV